MNIEKIINTPFTSWTNTNENDNDSEIVLSSRIRLARNLENVVFPNRASLQQLNVVLENLKKSLKGLKKNTEKEYTFFELSEITPLERYILAEKYIISINHAQEADGRGVIISEDLSTSIMINEEDHIRLQCMNPGLDLKSTLSMANTIDDVLESKNNYAFSEEMGYLTSCPTNLGTGLRASVMMHLPALTFTKQISRIISAVTQLGLTVRGLYGEGTDISGNIYQISNQLTMGNSETEIVANLDSIAKQIVEKERLAREIILNESKDALEDRVWRAYGILKYARKIGSSEALTLLSDIRLGVDIGLIKDVNSNIFNELIINTRPNYLQKVAGDKMMGNSTRDILRASIIRDKLK